MQSNRVKVKKLQVRAGILNNLWGLGVELEQGCRTGPPGYTASRNWFLGIDSWFLKSLKIRALTSDGPSVNGESAQRA
jgi:hypothetical protein